MDSKWIACVATQRDGPWGDGAGEKKSEESVSLHIYPLFLGLGEQLNQS